MRIGEFAKICNTKISVLRHYDKQNLLRPVYIDKFTGYRYYSQEQIAIFFRITALKQAGFSLNEIGDLLKKMECDADILAFFEKKRTELLETLHNLDEAKEIMIGAKNMLNVLFEEKDNGVWAKYMSNGETDYEALCEQVDQTLSGKDFQRISQFEKRENDIFCQVVKLKGEIGKLEEDTELLFEDDPAAVGKWEAVGEYVVKEEFFEGKKCRQNWYYEYPGILYFLPQGERYWCYGWTKGKLIIDTGASAFVNEYEIQQVGEETYMFVSFKTYDYRKGGVPKILVLRQVDKNHYSAKELAKKDDINMPFKPDDRVIGKWKVFDFIKDKKEFSAEGSGEPPIFFKEIEFFQDGSCTSIYGDEVISGDDKQVWTKGYVLRKWNSCACAYEIRVVDGKEFLIIEWKSGDYRWGGFPTDYYVFVKE